jgi:predicted Zn-dependent peptidase
MNLDYEFYKLNNGLSVVLIPVENTNSVNIHALVKTGSALENIKTQGLTHVVEHMALTCTESWPSKEALNTQTEFLGASLNGSTGKESLDYYVTLPYTQIEFGIKVIYEVLYKSLITEKNLKIEKTVIIDEINKSIDDPMHLDGDFIYNKLYGKDNGYSYDIAGTKDTVKSFTIEEVKKHYEFVHSPQKILLAITGNFKSLEIKKLIEKTFGSINYKYPVEEYKIPNYVKNLVEVEFNKKTGLIFADVIFEYKGVRDVSFKTDLIGYIARTILAGPMSSRLKKRMREEEGLLYGIAASSTIYNNFGLTSISYEVEPENFEKCFTTLNEELNKFFEKGISEEELNHYREYIINKWLLKYDDPKSYSRLIKYPLYLEVPVKSLDDMIEEIKNLSIKDINSFIKDFYSPKDANYFAFGNITNNTKDFMLNNIS